MTRTPAERTVAAECRAVEEGHQARRAGDGRHFLVRSDSVEGRDYYVRIVAGPEVVVFVCDHRTYVECVGSGRSVKGDGTCPRCGRSVEHEEGWARSHAVGGQPDRSFVTCKHAARAARRLEREGLLRWDGDRWLATPKAFDMAPAQSDDPFEGLGQ